MVSFKEIVAYKGDISFYSGMPSLFSFSQKKNNNKIKFCSQLENDVLALSVEIGGGGVRMGP